MSRIYQSVVSCLQKSPPASDKKDENTTTTDPSSVKENDSPEISVDKKTDAATEPEAPKGNILWRVTSGAVGLTTSAVTGTVGYGVSGVKWVAGKTADVGAAVYEKVPIGAKKKDKKE
ncbi:uncharacterized protein LOC141912578 [Tubulanus polymorphus]|uniref:uncharacterized protein LOC141912578 n=1 Tax=Tubulanus polymorphus TaxID=672921 RepID=UPI003DA497E8